MRSKLSVLGYTLSFLAGTVFSGGVALAATNYVQALHHTSSVILDGKTISHPDALVYKGTTYVQLYSVEQALKQVGITPGWDGNNFSMKSAPAPSNTSDIAGLSGGSSDDITVYSDLGHSMVNVGVSGDRLAELGQTNVSDATVITAIENDVQLFNDNYAALSKDSPSDLNLQNMLAQYLATLKQLVPLYTQLETSVKNNDQALAEQVLSELPSVEQQLSTIQQEFQSYTNTITGTSTSNTTG